MTDKNDGASLHEGTASTSPPAVTPLPAGGAVSALKNAKPIDWVSVALALSMPVLVAYQTYISTKQEPGAPSLQMALVIAASGSIVSMLQKIQEKRAARSDGSAA